MKRTIAILVAFFILANLTGCEPLRKKFTRKKKPPVKMPRIYQGKRYEKKPTPELYKKHYAYWASWQSELISVIGQNSKKDKRCIEEIIGNLNDMQNILVQEKADELKIHVEKLTKVKDIIFDDGVTTQSNKDYVKRILEKEGRVIKREFNYKKVKDFLRKSFEGDEEKGA